MKRLWKIVPVCLLALALVICVTLLTPKANATDVCPHCGEAVTQITYKEWTTGSGETATQSGHYYLRATVEGIKSQIKIGADGAPVDIFLDLRGNSLKATTVRIFSISTGSTLTIVDTVGGGELQGGGNGGNVINVAANATFNLYDATLTNVRTGSTSMGGVVNTTDGTEETPSVFNMYSGTLNGGNHAGNGGAVCVRKYAEFNMYSGVVNGATCTTEGKTPTGAAVATRDKTSVVRIYGGTIHAGVSEGRGDCVYVVADATFVVEGGNLLGGDVCVKTVGENAVILSGKVTIDNLDLTAGGIITLGRGGVTGGSITVIAEAGPITAASWYAAFSAPCFVSGQKTMKITVNTGNQICLTGTTIVESGTCGENLTWTLDDAGTLTISGVGPIENYSRDGSPWFSNSDITAIVVEPGVTAIGDYAFYGCSGLTGITISDSVTFIGNYTFFECSSLTGITIPNGVTSIGDSAFKQCSSLTSITIPDGVTSIGNSVFEYCSSLTEIIIPNSLTSIGNYAFFHCTSLTGITIPGSVISVGSGAFAGCSNLNFNIYDNAKYLGNDENPYFLLVEAISTDVTKCVIAENTKFVSSSAFKQCSSLTDITIPNSVTSIGHSAFYGCSSLIDITIPDSVTSIGYWAFYGCDCLTSVIIPNSVTQLEENAFTDCENLKSAVILEGVTDIAYRSFFASGLETIAIPESVVSISTAAFGDADNLRDVYYAGSQEQWEQITINYYNDSLLRANIHFNHTHNFVEGICAECMLSGGSDQPQGVPGDLTGDNQTNNEDVVLLLWHTLFPEDYPLGVSGDINKDVKVNNEDVVLLLWHTLFPEDYPL